MQFELRLNCDQEKVEYPKSEFEQINFNRKSQSIQVIDSTIPFYLPLPQIHSELGVARLLFKFKLRSLLNILMSLLLEYSVLVIGDSYEEVTSCTFALLELLKPYSWASVFIPLLPEEMIEFLSSPVPYIVGMVARDKAHLKKIESDSNVKMHIRAGLNVLNVTTGKIQWNEEKIVKEKKLVKASGIV